MSSLSSQSGNLDNDDQHTHAEAAPEDGCLLVRRELSPGLRELCSVRLRWVANQPAPGWALMRSRVAAYLLAVVGILVMAMGAYFVILRPAFLPEDLRFIGTDSAAFRAAPGVTSWLRYVFMVLGGYAFTSGLLTAHIGFTAIRSGRKMPAFLITFAGLTSLGIMVAVNFVIRSDFRYPLAGVGALWAFAVLLELPIGRISTSAQFGKPKA